jgi:hypothetical protein
MYLAAYQRGFMIIIANQYVDLPAKKVFWPRLLGFMES